jgi:aryl-alcohol dehydrogenase-like predicted oxidoreductase
VVLTTKMFIPTSDWPNHGGLSALNIRRAVEASLRRLDVDHIDLLQFHHIDRSTSLDEVWEATERLVTQGKLIYAGTSNFAGWHIAAATEAAARRQFLGPISEGSVAFTDRKDPGRLDR